jgi:hypothetical protein
LGKTGSGEEAGHFGVKSGSRVVGLVDGLIRQLAFSLSKIVTLVQDDRGAAHMGREDEDIGIGGEQNILS